MKTFAALMILAVLSVSTVLNGDVYMTRGNEVASQDAVLNWNNCAAPSSMLALTFPDSDYQRGCCSWHGGVCGCDNGRVVCCDGSLSPSCRC